MKTSLLFISLLLCISTSFLYILAAEAPEPVVVGGKKLRAGIPYHVVGADINGNTIGGYGVTFFSTDSTTSPVEVMEESIGTPVFFSPVNPKKGVLRESTDLNVQFWDTTEVWKLDRYERKTKKYFISTGGVVGNPGPQTLSNWFKLEKYGNAYKFMYCPSVCPNCKVICKDVGIFMKDGQRRLALSDVPFLVTFIEHDD